MAMAVVWRKILAYGAIVLLGVLGVLEPASASGTSRHWHRAGNVGQPVYPVTVSTPYGPLRLTRRPQRVISLSPTATEMLFAIGAGPEVIAVDNDSNYPASAPRTTLSGYTPNVEAIASYRPDLVVISYNPTPPNLVQALRVLHIPVLYLPAASNLAQTYAEILELGKVTGERGPAFELVTSMRARIARLVRAVRHPNRHLTYFYELDPTLYTATGDTFIGSILALAGLRDITGPFVHGNDYPQLSPEAVLRANPTFILLADGSTPASVAARPGWSALAAVRNHRVISLNEDIASRWGPRIVDLLAQVVHLVNELPVAKAG
jgi:iron complex transport system substrate-binding protein